MLAERRRKRSSFAGLSLQYWLNAVAQQKRLFALVLADSAGLLIGASMTGPEAEELAAVAPLLARPNNAECNPMPERNKIPVVVQPMRLDHASLFLCAVGDRERGKEGIRLAASGVRRILTAH